MKRTSKISVIALIVAAGFLTVISTNQVAHAQVPLKITNTYAAKFVCGGQTNSNISTNPYPDVQAGRYSTKLEVHNDTGIPITFRKKIIMLSGGEVPTAPQWKSESESLRPDWALEVVCQDIYGYLGIKPPPQGDPWKYINGFVIFEVFYNSATQKPPPADPLDVEGVYTYKGDLPGGNNSNASGVSIEVVVFPAKANAHLLN